MYYVLFIPDVNSWHLVLTINFDNWIKSLEKYTIIVFNTSTFHLTQLTAYAAEKLTCSKPLFTPGLFGGNGASWHSMDAMPACTLICMDTD